jgi:hypothetical protein
MVYEPEINVLDLETELIPQMQTVGFERIDLEALPADLRKKLIERDGREVAGCVGFAPVQQWRDDEDYLLFSDGKNSVYVRRGPDAPRSPLSHPFDLHMCIASEVGFSSNQYNSLVLPQELLDRLGEVLTNEFQGSSVGFARFDRANPLEEIQHSCGSIEGDDELPVRMCYSVDMNIHKSSPQLVQIASAGIQGVTVQAKLASERQRDFYKSAAAINARYAESAILPTS